MDFAVVEQAIKDIEKVRPDIANKAWKLLKRGMNVACKADGKAKDILFAEIHREIKAARVALHGRVQRKLKTMEISDAQETMDALNAVGVIEDFKDDAAVTMCSGG